MTNYRWSESWTAIVSDDDVTLNAGSDLSFTTEVTDALHAVLGSTSDTMKRPENPDLRAVFDQLVVVGVIVPVIPETVAVAVRWVGAKRPELLEGIAVDPAADTSLMIRTNGTLSDVLKSIEEDPLDNYLFVDAAYHHTFSIGPFAVEGAACAACLAGRLRERWGDNTPPAEPGALGDVDLLNAILRREVRQLAAGRPTLTNATSTWDLATGQSKREVLYRVPSCPVCADTPTANGRFDLPWTK